MKKFRIKMPVFFILFLSLAISRGWAVESMAVFGSRDKGVDSELAGNMFSAIEFEVMKSGRFKVIGVEKAMRAWKNADTEFDIDCRNPICMIVMAKTLEVKKLLLPALTSEGNKIKLDLKVFEEVSGKLSFEKGIYLSKQGWRSELNSFIADNIANIPRVGKAVSVEKDILRLDIGSSQGLSVDREFKVFRFKDFYSGKRYLFKDEIEVGNIKITKVDNNTSTAELISSTRDCKKGDVLFLTGPFLAKVVKKALEVKEPVVFSGAEVVIVRKPLPKKEIKTVKKKAVSPPEESKKQVKKSKKQVKRKLQIYDVGSKKVISDKEAEKQFGITIVRGENPTDILNILSKPKGATIFLDENKMGFTPKMISGITPGKHRLRLKLEGYEELNRDLEMKSAEPMELNISLVPFQARLEVRSIPMGCTLLLDGKPKKMVEGGIMVNPGKHKLELRKDGYLSKTKVVEVSRGKKISILLELKRKGDGPSGMVFIPAGTFLMGSSDKNSNESPRRNVFVDAFYIDRQEVTNAEYRKFLKKTGRLAPDFLDDPDMGKSNHPVVGVNWEDAAAYAKWVGKRLPTEAEWEKAARGVKGIIYPWGNTFDAKKTNASGKKDGYFYTAPVNKFKGGISPYGVLNMSGNVWEWCADFYQDDYYTTAPKKNPKGPSTGALRVIRGGSWDNGPSQHRTSNRSAADTYTARYDLGFRCAR